MSEESRFDLDDRHGGTDDPLRYATSYHAPVLWHTVVRDLITDVDGVYVDGTLGGGGHTAALLDVLGEGAKVIGIDRDERAIDEAGRRLSGEIDRGRLVLVHGAFGDLAHHLKQIGIEKVNGVVLDLGVSSHQIDASDRGFSYRESGELDMRMDRSAGLSALSIINDWPQDRLADVIYEFGEESASRRIARTIVAARPISSTHELAELVRAAVPTRDEVKTLSRVFQAIRIAVNDELGEVERALEAMAETIVIGGRAVVISYHSLEDRRVKRFFRTGNFEGVLERDTFGNPLVGWKELHRKPVEAGPIEVERNPRARSARLRSAERVRVPAQ